jgi:hypothetical protein
LGLGCGPRSPDNRRVQEKTEIVAERVWTAYQLRGTKLLSDHDILTKWLYYSDEEVSDIIAKLKLQKLEELKLQVMAQNPVGLMIRMPGEA